MAIARVIDRYKVAKVPVALCVVVAGVRSGAGSQILNSRFSHPSDKTRCFSTRDTPPLTMALAAASSLVRARRMQLREKRRSREHRQSSGGRKIVSDPSLSRRQRRQTGRRSIQIGEQAHGQEKKSIGGQGGTQCAASALCQHQLRPE